MYTLTLEGAAMLGGPAVAGGATATAPVWGTAAVVAGAVIIIPVLGVMVWSYSQTPPSTVTYPYGVGNPIPMSVTCVLPVPAPPMNRQQVAPASGNGGRDCDPCPPNSAAWEVLDPAHGGTTSHWHWIVYDQNPSDCECNPRRETSGTRPPGA
jgi:hypothetical protein